ncbi:hypothetical protein ABZU86_23875 [Streptomyces sp. NPDC005271]|uniref:hypothetical protein n=1 Tax=unclassified Streptomyces TaxID=2593676 RepID=UPI0033BA0E83
MRTLLALVLSWLLPSTGKRRGTPPAQDATDTTAADAPTRRLIIAPLPAPFSVPRPGDAHDFRVIVADELPLVRPYVIAHERERERQRQRDRRTALALATLGIDFHGVTA